MTNSATDVATVDHDLHVHTILSGCCHDETATPHNMIRRAAEAGLRTIGFADHMWDARVPGASPWYRPQDFERIDRMRAALPSDTHGVRVLVGCETEYCGGGKVGISRETAARLDFVLVPHSHLHMTGFVAPALDGPGAIAALLVERFHEVVELGLATGIAHPFLPLGYEDRTDAALALIPEGVYLDAFGRAADRGISIEITTGFFPSLRGGETDGFHDETFLRVLSLARRAGCLFHFASDTHRLAGVGDGLKLQPFAAALGLTARDVLPLARG